MRRAVNALPGFVVLLFGAVLARGLSEFTGFNELLLAIALGVLLANSIDVPESLHAGLATHKIWLASGIVLLGASLTLDTVLEIGPSALSLMLATVTVTVLTVEALARNVAGLTERFGSLLAAGAGVCGVSAVVAVGGGIQARETEIAYAAAVVLLMDAITLVVYPIVGAYLNLPGDVFGVWAGVSMLSTGPTVAVGFVHSEVAGQWATMTKLSRNALIGAVTLGYTGYYAHRGSDESASLKLLWTDFPKFVLGFLALVVFASAGAFSPGQHATIENAVDWLFLLAFVGLGAEIRIGDLRGIGIVPVLVVFTTVLVVSVLSLGVALAVL